jgi:hypothetical protein
MKLEEFFLSHDGRLINKWLHYFPIYDRYFSKYKSRKITLLEIGISHGGSLEIWKKYFGADIQIFAIDVNEECKKFEDENVKVFIGSQSDASFLEDVVKQMPPPDIIIDDGGHTMTQQITSFNTLFKYLKNDGVYLCEDTHTSYWKAYGGGLRRKTSFIEYAKTLIDNINAWHIDKKENFPITEITKTVNSIHFYDSVVVFEKTAERVKPSSMMIGYETIAPFVEPALRKKESFLKKIFRKKGFSKQGEPF